MPPFGPQNLIGPQLPGKIHQENTTSALFTNLLQTSVPKGSVFGIGSSSSVSTAVSGSAASSAANIAGGFATGGMLGVAASVGQEIIAGIARKKASKREAKAFQLSGNRLLQQATTIEELSGFDELEFREQSGIELSSIESLFADAGVGLTGSTLDVLLASKRRLEIDALKIRESGKREAEESRFQAGQSFQSAQFARDAADKSFFGLS